MNGFDRTVAAVTFGLVFGMYVFVILTSDHYAGNSIPVCAAEDEVVVMVDYPHPEDGYRCVHIDTLGGRR